MNNVVKIIVLGVIGCLVSQIYAIKLTNTTNNDLLYCCGNSLNKNASLEKHELKSNSTIEIIANQDYLQIYTIQKPNTLSGKYTLSKETTDLSIITNPIFGYAFKPTADLSQEPKRIPDNIKVPIYTVPTSAKLKDEDKLNDPIQEPSLIKPESSTQQTNLQNNKLTHLTKYRPQNTKKRLPSKSKIEIKNPIQNQSTIDNQYQHDIAAKDVQVTDSLPQEDRNLKQENTQSIYTSYLTKKSLALGLGIVGVAYVTWWYYRSKK